MSAPLARPGLTTCLAEPSGAMAQIKPLFSSAAMSEPAKSPNVSGATAIPPSTAGAVLVITWLEPGDHQDRSEEHTSELQSLAYIVCRLLLEQKTPCLAVYLHGAS